MECDDEEIKEEPGAAPGLGRTLVGKLWLEAAKSFIESVATLIDETRANMQMHYVKEPRVYWKIERDIETVRSELVSVGTNLMPRTQVEYDAWSKLTSEIIGATVFENWLHGIDCARSYIRHISKPFEEYRVHLLACSIPTFVRGVVCAARCRCRRFVVTRDKLAEFN